MTISKKLFFIGTLVLGMQPIAQAYTINNQTDYQTRQMLDFAQQLRQHHTSNQQAIKVAQWLEQQVYDSYNIVSNDDLALVTKTIDNYSLSIDSKIIMLSQAMSNKKQLFFFVMNGLLATGAVVILANGIAIGMHLLTDEMSNSTLSKIFAKNIDRTNQPNPASKKSIFNIHA